MVKAIRQKYLTPIAQQGVAFSRVQEIARELPGIEDSTSYGTPALKVRGALLARLKEDGETLVLKTTFADRELLLGGRPDVFYLTDHYLKHPWVLVRLPQIDESLLRELIIEAWRLTAPARLVIAFGDG